MTYLSVLLFRDEHGAWIAQGIERDIAAHGSSPEEAKIAFTRTVLGYFKLAAKHQREPLASLQPAPTVFAEAWKRAYTAQTQLERLPSEDPAVPPAFMIPAITHEPITRIH